MKTTFLLFLLFPAYAWSASNISSIDFFGTQAPNIIQVRADGPLTFEKQENPGDNQVVIEFSNARIAKSASRKIDTSSFNSSVTLISPYQVADRENTVRVVLQLRNAVPVAAFSEGNSVKITVPVGAQNTTELNPEVSPAVPLLPPAEGQSANQGTQATTKDPLDEYFQSTVTKRYIGSPITLNVKDVDTNDVLRLIGDVSGFNIIADNVVGKVTISVVDAPWDQVLDLILQSNGLGAERNNNILRVTSLENLIKEKKAQAEAEKAKKSTAPRVTKLFPISYAKLEDLKVTLKNFASTISDSGEAGVVELDQRTNSILVRDTADNIDKMKKLVEMLDTQTPQILIEGKIIEASESFSRTFSGNLGMGLVGGNSGSYVASFNAGKLTGAGSTVSTAGGASFGLAPDFSVFTNNFRLNAILNLAENEQTIKVVSSPKTVVLNKSTANIIQGTPVAVPSTTVNSDGSRTTTYTINNANLSLNVVPTVTNDGSVLMKLKMQKDVPITLTAELSAVAPRSIETEVLVESGSTLSIGGIYSIYESNQNEGIPWIRKIPLIGWFFGSDIKVQEKSEIFIFITPRIINTREAGMAES